VFSTVTETPILIRIRRHSSRDSIEPYTDKRLNEAGLNLKRFANQVTFSEEAEGEAEKLEYSEELDITGE
jgi:hypothetical protein